MDWSQPVSGEDLEGSDSLQILLDDDLDFFGGVGCWVELGVGLVGDECIENIRCMICLLHL